MPWRCVAYGVGENAMSPKKYATDREATETHFLTPEGVTIRTLFPILLNEVCILVYTFNGADRYVVNR